ncbi:hypothetical protein B566_EDAN018215, partial [Ephemera danica]
MDAPAGDGPLLRAIQVQGHRYDTTYYHFDGFNYVYRNETEECVYLRCSEQDCQGTAKESDQAGFVKTRDHYPYHPPDELYPRYAEMRAALRTQAVTNWRARPREIFDALRNMFPEVADRISFHCVRSNIHKIRRETYPQIPATLEDLADTLINPQYLAQFSVPGPNGEHFSFFRGSNVPVLYALMSSKTEQAYMEIFVHLRDVLCPGLNPQEAMCDFERGLQNAIVEVWPNIRITGCWFHYTQALWRHVQWYDLLRYVCEHETWGVIGMAMALPLLPAAQIQNGMACIRQRASDAGITQRMQAFLDYVQTQWLENVGVEVISVAGQPTRTNNGEESNHKLLNVKVGVARPSVWVFY